MTDVKPKTPNKRKSMPNKDQGSAKKVKLVKTEDNSPKSPNLKNGTPKNKKQTPNKMKKFPGTGDNKPKITAPVPRNDSQQTNNDKKEKKKLKKQNKDKKEGTDGTPKKRKAQFTDIKLKAKEGDKSVVEDIDKRIKIIEDRSEITKTARRKLSLLKKMKNVALGLPTTPQVQKKKENSGSESTKRRNRKKNAQKAKSEGEGAAKKTKKEVPEGKKGKKVKEIVKEAEDSDDEAEEDSDDNVQAEESDDSGDGEEAAEQEGSDDSEEDDSDDEEEENLTLNSTMSEENDNSDSEDSDTEEIKIKAKKLKFDKSQPKPNKNLKTLESNADVKPAKKLKHENNKSKNKNLDGKRKTTDHQESEKPKNKELEIKDLEKGNIMQKGQKRFVLFVGNIPYETTTHDLKQHFSKIGEVKHVRVPTEKGSNRPRGFAYVEVGDEQAYQKCLSMHHSTLNGRRINVMYTEGGKKNNEDQKKKIKAKNFKLHAMRREGQLAGSTKDSKKRSFRRNKAKMFKQQESQNDE